MKCQICRDNIVSPNNSNEKKHRKELPKMEDITTIVKLLSHMVAEDQELFVKFLRKLCAEQDTQDKKEPVSSAHPTDENT